MSAPVLTAMPATFEAGTSVTYVRHYANFSPADGWSLAARLNGLAAMLATVTATADNTGWNVTFPATGSPKTGDLNTGGTPLIYSLTERVTKGADVQTAAHVQVTVTPDLINAAAGVTQLWEETELARLRAEKAKLDATESYGVDGQGAKKRAMKEVQDQIDRMEQRLAIIRGSGGFGPRILGHFGCGPGYSTGFGSY